MRAQGGLRALIPVLAIAILAMAPTGAACQGGATTASPDTSSCFDCAEPMRFRRAAGELLIVQLIPWSVNRIVRDAEWADISLETWGRNLENPWQWDNNAFVNNQISHPYHGNLYYNAGRANGYDFWQSALWSFSGSLMWEYFAEVWAPAPNDLLNTSLGGITIGESMWRLSSLTLDNTSTGFERGMREGVAFLLNPVRGFNRLLDGKMNRVGPNPEDWRPSKWRWSLDAGVRSTSGDFADDPLVEADQWTTEAQLDFGESMD
jgi:hypothetical protein